MNSGKVIAITGRSGCGKTCVSNFYTSKGYTVIDCDKIAAKIHENPNCIEKLSEYFGKDIIDENCKLDKKKLAQKAFDNQQSLKKLTEITHPFIIKEILDRINIAFLQGEKLVFVDGAVIIGYEFEKYCDEFILVISDSAVQCNRLVKRDSITYKQAENRLLKQLSYPQIFPKATYIIYNNSSINSLNYQADFILRQILKKL